MKVGDIKISAYRRDICIHHVTFHWGKTEDLRDNSKGKEKLNEPTGLEIVHSAGGGI